MIVDSILIFAGYLIGVTVLIAIDEYYDIDTPSVVPYFWPFVLLFLPFYFLAAAPEFVGRWIGKKFRGH